MRKIMLFLICLFTLVSSYTSADNLVLNKDYYPINNTNKESIAKTKEEKVIEQVDNVLNNITTKTDVNDVMKQVDEIILKEGGEHKGIIIDYLNDYLNNYNNANKDIEKKIKVLIRELKCQQGRIYLATIVYFVGIFILCGLIITVFINADTSDLPEPSYIDVFFYISIIIILILFTFVMGSFVFMNNKQLFKIIIIITIIVFLYILTDNLFINKIKEGIKKKLGIPTQEELDLIRETKEISGGKLYLKKISQGGNNRYVVFNKEIISVVSPEYSFNDDFLLNHTNKYMFCQDIDGLFKIIDLKGNILFDEIKESFKCYREDIYELSGFILNINKGVKLFDMDMNYIDLPFNYSDIEDIKGISNIYIIKIKDRIEDKIVLVSIENGIELPFLMNDITFEESKYLNIELSYGDIIKYDLINDKFE